MSINSFVGLIKDELLKEVSIRSEDEFEPVVVKDIPRLWKCLGTGNYAAVFMHKEYKDWVVKVYVREGEGIEKESEVYRRMGDHPSYSKLIYKGENFIVLKRLKEITLYDAIHKGIKIPKQVILDINEALEYAREQGLTPCDVHGKNVMMEKGKGRGYVVDVSDFLKTKEDSKWRDLEKAYFTFYFPFIYKLPFPVKIPYFMLNIVRRSYRKYKKLKKNFKL